MRKKTYWIVFAISSLLQGLLMAAVVVLHRLSNSRGGVNHHLMFRKAQYQNRFFTPEKLVVYTVVLAAIAAVYLLVFLKRRRKQRPANPAVYLLPVVWPVAVLEFLHLPVFKATLVYPYLVAAAAGVLLLMALNALLYRAVK